MLDLTFPKEPTQGAAPPPRAPATVTPKAIAAAVPDAAVVPQAAAQVSASAQASAAAPVAAATPSAAPATSSSAAPAASTSDSRATAFEAVEGGTETKSGTVLMVEAYAFIWVLLAGWVFLTFRKAERMDARLNDLEAALDRAAAAKAGAKSGASGAKEP